VVANLWDVTDKDIDRFAKATFAGFGLSGSDTAPSALPAAIAASRSACTLRYLNGAAPIIWGFPVRIGDSTPMSID
jgi:separase